MIAYVSSGLYLIRILRRHQRGESGTGEDTEGSKTASPFDLVITKTYRSMILLALPSIAVVGLLGFSIKLTADRKPIWDENHFEISGVLIYYMQLCLGIAFTRVVWITPEHINAALAGRSRPSSAPVSSTGSEERRATKGGTSRNEMKSKAAQLSQASIPATHDPDEKMVIDIEPPALSDEEVEMQTPEQPKRIMGIFVEDVSVADPNSVVSTPESSFSITSSLVSTETSSRSMTSISRSMTSNSEGMASDQPESP